MSSEPLKGSKEKFEILLEPNKLAELKYCGAWPRLVPKSDIFKSNGVKSSPTGLKSKKIKPSQVMT